MSILDHMLFDAEAVQAEMNRQKSARVANPDICICGHSARSHSSHARLENLIHEAFRAQGVTRCLPGRQTCPCVEFNGVLRVSDVRGFICKTTGPYSAHALTKGILGLTAKGGQAEMIGVWSCSGCGSQEKVGPVAITQTGKESLEPSPINYMLCVDCLVRLRVGTLFTDVDKSDDEV